MSGADNHLDVPLLANGDKTLCVKLKDILESRGVAFVQLSGT